MTNEINAAETSKRELTSDELDTVSGGAAAENLEDYNPGAHMGDAIVSAAFGIFTSFFCR
jgi:hypothetical protein